jgi:hypothetical protein
LDAHRPVRRTQPQQDTPVRSILHTRCTRWRKRKFPSTPINERTIATITDHGDADTLLGSLALRLADHPENIATESLLFLLRRSATAREALRRLVGTLDPQFAHIPVTYSSQVTGLDGEIPDLVGSDASGREVLLVEAKFWAGLTDAQPVQYLERLAVAGGILLFVAPAQRLETLWPELEGRCCRANLAPTLMTRQATHRSVGLGDGRVLALTSWRHLLTTLHAALDGAGETALAADARQLIGLCDAMDSRAFLPLRSEELTGTLATRVCQFADLVDTLAAELVRRGIASKKGLRAAGSRTWYGHYLMIGGYGCLLAYAAHRWSANGYSPIWLRVKDASTVPWRALPTLDPKITASLPDATVIDTPDGMLFPVLLPAGREWDGVVAEALAQVLAVSEALQRAPRAAGTVLPVPVGDPDEIA